MIDTLLGIAPPQASGWVSKDPADDYWYQPRGVETIAGVDIDEDAAMGIPTVFACVAKVAKTIAALPLSVVEKTGPNSRQPVDHPLAELLTTAANEDSTGLASREAAEANLELWGGSYYGVDWDSRGREPRRLTHLPSRDMTQKRDEDGELYFVYRPSGSGPEIIPADRMWYTPGLSLNGIIGFSTVSYNRELCGFSRATNQFGSAFFGNGAWAGGFVKRGLDAPDLSEKAAERWLESLNEKFRGSAKAFGFGLLREGMEFQQIDMPMEDAMFLGTRRHNRVEICGWFDVPLILIQDDERSIYNNAEQLNLHFQQHGILPRILRREMSARKRFFQGTKLYLKHNLAGFVRADFKSQMEGFAIGRQWGLFSINDCRALLDMNPIVDGDEYLSPLNMVPVGQPRPTQIGGNPDKQDQPPAGLTTERVRQLALAYASLEVSPADSGNLALAVLQPSIEHVAAEIATRQIKAVSDAHRRYLEKSPDVAAFRTWADKWFSGNLKVTRQKFRPLWKGCEESIGRRLKTSPEELADAINEEYHAATLAADDVIGLVESWKESMASAIVARLCETLSE